MHKFILGILLVSFFSCGKLIKESEESNTESTIKEVQREVDVVLPIQKHASIPLDTTVSRQLSKKEIATIFTEKRQIKLGLSNKIYQVYSYKDTADEYFLVLTDHIAETTPEKDTLYDNIYALNLINKNYRFKKKSTIQGEIKDEWETSIGFWNQYCQLTDLNNDGIIDPILVYGTTGQNQYEDGRVRIMTYYNRRRVSIKHQNSEIEDGRLTKINENLYTFPEEIQEAVKEKMRQMIKNGHATFTKGWEKEMKKKATRLYKK